MVVAVPESVVSLRLPAVIWTASTALVVAERESFLDLGVVGAVAWSVFLAGAVYFLVRVWYAVRSPAASP